jgi:hypothetical protein
MRKLAAMAIIAAAGLAGLLGASGADNTKVAKKQEALNAEYSLAKDANFYFVLDVLGRKLELKVRGMVLRTWPLQSMRFWGQPDFSGSVELARKTALKAPERIIIKPGETEAPAPAAAPKPAATGAAPTAADFDLEALELRDMPKRFRLGFNNGLNVTIKTKEAGTRSLGGTLRDAWRWYLDIPLRNLFDAKDGQGLSELELVFEDGKDAQSIYWHFFDGIKGIIL